MADLVFELRAEELPPKDVRAATCALEAALAGALRDAGLAFASTSAAWTPRRMAVWAHDVAERSPDREERVKGPPARVAFDADGRPTKAAEGFARKSGVELDALEREGDYVFAVVRTAGRDARDVVAEVLPGLAAQVPWRKSMRWGAPATFARPIRGVVALLGSEVVPCEVAGLAAGRVTRGHPFLSGGDVVLEDASRDAYVERLRAAHVLADPDERREAVLAAARAQVPGLQVGEVLLEEVVNLVEWPSALTGRFAEAYLELPPRLLVTVMEHHQRFFHVRAADGRLAPRFVAVMDRTEASADVCRPGFERVLVPRLHDASFFLREDRKAPLAARLPALEDVVYHRKLGSLRDKAARLEALAPRVAELLGLDPGEAASAGRAGLLAKCDLVTLMVGEFPELQGHVGSVYAAADGEDAAVAEALDWQYRHDLDGADRPSGVALALLLAENLDVLCQFGARVGLPTGSADPFGVRRAALTFVDACERWAPDLPLAAALEAAGGNDEVETYLRARVVRRLRDRGVPADHVEAVAGYTTLGALLGRIADLHALSEAAGFPRLLEVAERCRNITQKSDAPPAAVDPGLLAEDAEEALHAVWAPLRDSLPAAPAPLSRQDAVRIAGELAEPLHRFFEEVFVNAEDPALRANRHALLREIDATLLRFADLCRVVKRG